MNLTELISALHASPVPENSKAFADFFRAMVENNDQVYTAVKAAGSGYAIDTCEHAGSFYVTMFSDSGNAQAANGSRLATIGLSNLIDSCYANPHILGIAINPSDSHPVFIQRKDLQVLSGKPDPRQAERSWGEGIPEYTEADLMVAEEAVDFAMEIVARDGLGPNGFELIESNSGLTAFPNFVVSRNGQLYFIAVDVSLAPNVPKLRPDVKDKIIAISNEQNAKCYYAPVSFSSVDGERAAAGLALVGDSFVGNFPGFVELN